MVEHGEQIFAEVPQYGQGIQQIWTEGQRQWATLSSRGTVMTAEKSGHYAYLDRPDLVVAQVDELARH